MNKRGVASTFQAAHMATVSSLQPREKPPCSDDVAWFEVERERALSASTPPASCQVELDLSTISLPTAIGGDGGPLRPRHDGDAQNLRPYREVVTTRMYTVPPRAAAPVRLSTPVRPPTERSRDRKRSDNTERAWSARPCRQQPRSSGIAGNPGRYADDGARFTTRSPKSAPTTRQLGGFDKSSKKHSTATCRNRVGPFGVRSNLDDDSAYCPYRASHIAQEQPEQRKRVQGRPNTAALRARVFERWGNEDPRPPAKPRAMSAPARRLAIRLAVDGCCKDLPATPNLSSGGKRFLQQWDRASRVQRGRLLNALADQLLVGDPREGVIQEPASLVEADSSNNVDMKWRYDGQDFSWGQSVAPETDSPFCLRPRPFVFGNDISTDRHNDFDSVQRGGPPRHGHQVGGTTQTGGHGTDIAEHSDHRRAPALVPPPPNPGFLELLGPHAGLFAMRISSFLRTSHACGHTMGPCLRVMNLLAESTAEFARGSGGGGGGSSTTTTSLAQQLSSPGMIRSALELVAGEPVEGQITTATPASPPKEENNRAGALRLLIALVRAGGSRVKESLTCSSSFIGPGKLGDALSPTVKALRRPGCKEDTRAAGVRLLVELGAGNPAGTCKVWNAVLCLLGHDETRDGQMAGCNVALQLLARTASLSSGDSGQCDRSSSQQQGRLQPELLLVPLVLSLSMTSDCGDIRETAGKLAAFLATFPGSTCYLLTAGLVGVLGRVSGVDRGAPVAWLQRQRPSGSRASTTIHEDAAQTINQSELLLRGPSSFNEVPPGGATRDECNDFEGAPSSYEAHPAFPSGGRSGKQQSATESVGDDGISRAHRGSDRGDQSGTAGSARSFDVSPAGGETVGATCDGDDHAIRAMALLRRICTGRGGEEVCRALRFALAPLAVLDLIVGPKLAAKPSSAATEMHKSPTGTTKRKVFITQEATETVADCGGEAIGGADLWVGEARRGRGERNDQPRGSELPMRCSTRGAVVSVDPFSEGQKAARPPVVPAHILAVAEALVAMYRRGGGGFTSRVEFATTNRADQDGGPTGPLACPGASSSRTPQDERGTGNSSGDEIHLDLKGMIDATLDDCPTLLCYLRNGDATALAKALARRGPGREIDSGGRGAAFAEAGRLRNNIHAMTKRLGRVRPPPGNNGGVPGRGSATGACGERRRRAGSPEHTGRILISPKNGEDDGSESVAPRGPGDVGNRWPALQAAPSVIYEGSWAGPFVATRASELQQLARRRKYRRSVAATPPSVPPPLEQRSRLWITRTASTGRRGAATAAAAAAADTGTPGESPRVWGPDDWGEDAPTMAMLTTPIARRRKIPERKDGERPGPVWRSTFGGGYGTSCFSVDVATMTRLKGGGNQNGKTSTGDSNNADHGNAGDNTAGDTPHAPPTVNVQVSAEAPTGDGSGRTTDQSRACPGSAAPSAAAPLRGAASNPRGVKCLEMKEARGKPKTTDVDKINRQKTALGTKDGKEALVKKNWTSSRFYSTRRRGHPTTAATAAAAAAAAAGAAAARKAQTKKQPRGAGGEGHRKRPRKRGRGRGDASPAVSLLLLRLSATPSKQHPKMDDNGGGNTDSSANSETQRWKGRTAPPALQTSRIDAEAFEVAERYATTAVGMRRSRRGCAGRAVGDGYGGTASGGSGRAPRA